MLGWITLCFIVLGASGAPARDEDVLCDVCHMLVGEIQDLVQVGTAQNEITNYVGEICQKLPSDEKDVCYQVIQGHSEAIFHKLVLDLTPHQVCLKLSNVCQPSVQEPEVEPIQETEAEPVEESEVEPIEEPEVEPFEESEEVAVRDLNSLECDVCKFLIQLVESELKKNKTIAAINSTLMGLCNRLPEEIGDLCKQIEPDVIDALEKGYSPEAACEFLKLCTEGATSDISLIPCDICYTVMATVGVKDREAVCGKLQTCQDEVEKESVITPEEKPQGELECAICKFLIEALEKYIENNKTIAAINSTLETLCQSLPDSIRGPCEEVVPYLIQVLEQGVAPEAACELATLCSGKSDVGTSLIPCDACFAALEIAGIKDSRAVCSKLQTCQDEEKANLEEPNFVEEPENPIECQLCKFLILAVDKLVGENKTVAAVNHTLIELCNAFPESLKTDCLNVEPDIVKAFRGGIAPEVACDFIKACNSKADFPFVDLNAVPCDVCQTTLEAVAGEKGVGLCFEIPGVCLMPGQLMEQEPEPTRLPIPMCEVCEFMVKSVGEQLKDNSEEAVIGTFERVCNLMPELEQKFCTKYGSAVIELLMAGSSDPRQSCVEMTVCKPLAPEEEDLEQETAVAMEDGEPEETPVVKEMQQEGNVKDDAKCELCELLILFLDQVLKDNASLPVVNASLYKFCDFLPENFQKLDDARCELCKFTVQLLDEALKNSGPQINNTLYAVCNALPETIKPTCISLIPTVEQAAKQGLPPQQTCITAGFCQSGTSINEPLPELCDRCMGIFEGMDEKAADTLCSKMCHGRHKRSLGKLQFGVEDLKKIEKDLTKTGNVGGLAECTTCKVLIQALVDFIQQNKTEKSVNDTVYEICLRLTGGQLVHMCLQDAPKLVKIILGGVDPEKACITLGMCTENKGLKEDTTRKLVKRAVKEKETKNVDNIECSLCKVVVQLVDKELQKNSSAKKINETVYNFCSTLPSAELKALCYAVAPVIVNDTEKGFDPTRVCQDVGLCPKQNRKLNTVSDGIILKSEVVKETVEKKLKMEQTNLGKSVECLLCEAVIQQLDKEMEKNSTEKKVNATVYGICEKLPGAFQDLCLKYAPQIVQEVEGGLDPDFVCEKIGLCKSKTKMGHASVIELQDTACDICQVVVEIGSAFIPPNETDAKVNATLYDICDNDIPSFLHDLCVEEIPALLHVFDDRQDPMKACQDVGLCESSFGLKGLTKTVPVMTPEKKPLKCQVCSKVMEYIYDDLIDNYPKIRRAIMEKVCNKLPDNYKAPCTKISSSNLSGHWKVFLDNYTPASLCEMAECVEESYYYYQPNEDNRT